MTDPIIIKTETNSDEIYLKKDQLKGKIDSLLKKQ